MRNTQLDRIMKLVRRTGDRFVIFDKESDEVVAVMNLDEYERLLAGSQPVEDLDDEEMMRKINRDIAAWRARQSYDELANEDVDATSWEDDLTEEEDATSLDDLDELSPVEEPESPEEPRYIAKNTSEALPVSEADEVSLDDLPHDDDEEEKFYLEPVE